MSKLKPCPFCGAKAELIKGRFSKATWFVGCSDCSTMVMSKEGKSTKKKAIEAWNKRATTPIEGKPVHLRMPDGSTIPAVEWEATLVNTKEQQLKDELLNAYRGLVLNTTIGFDNQESTDKRIEGLVGYIKFKAKIAELEAKLKEANEPKPQNK